MSKRYQLLKRADLPQANLLGWDFGMPIPEGAMPGIGSVVVPLARGFDVPYHSHPNADVWILSMCGRARGTLDGQQTDIEPGDVIYIPPGCAHKWETLSDEEWISFAVHQPPVYTTEEVLDFERVPTTKAVT
jgi:quercetin dioxygenase-like cupin family protein